MLTNARRRLLDLLERSPGDQYVITLACKTMGQRAADAVRESCTKNKNRISQSLYLWPSHV